MDREESPLNADKAESDLGGDSAVAAKSPLKVTANVNSEELNVRLEVVDPAVRLSKFQMRIDPKDVTKPISCQSVITTKKSKVSREEASKAWKDIFKKPSEEASSDAREGLPSYAQRKCPFYKRIPNTSFVVDAFNYGTVPGVTKYFLSHFHYDHYRGLGKNFAHTIVCSRVTARLAKMKIGLNPSRVMDLRVGESRVIDGVEVTLLDANHCPGAVMFLFRLLNGVTYLHCGDFRANPGMEEYPQLWSCQVDKVYLDTTYCKPEHDFPEQSEVIRACVEAVKGLLTKYPKTLILVGSYTIGKERVFSSLAEELDCQIWASKEKTRVLKALDEPAIKSRLTGDAASAQIHVVDMGKTRNRRDLRQYMELIGPPGRFNHVLAVSPTGWTHSRGATREESLTGMAIKTYGDVSSFDVPYSEHSSFSELRRFVKFLRLRSPDCVIPTVNVGRADEREAMKQLFNIWISDEKTVRENLNRDNAVPRKN